MRRLVLLLSLFSLPWSAWGQTAPAAPSNAALTPDQEAVLVALPVLATAGGVAVIARTDRFAGVVALPLLSAAAVCAAGSALSAGGDCKAALASAGLWTLPGYALVGLGAAAGPWDGLAGLFLGGLWLAVAPPIAAIDGYRRSAERQALGVSPTVVTDPATQRAAAGLRLRVRL